MSNNPPKSLWEIWIGEGGDGTRASFVVHLYKLGANYFTPVLYGMPRNLEIENPNNLLGNLKSSIDLRKARQLAKELQTILGE